MRSTCTSHCYPATFNGGSTVSQENEAIISSSLANGHSKVVYSDNGVKIPEVKLPT